MYRPLTAGLLLASAAALSAQVPSGNSAPQPLPFAATIPDPVDQPYPATIRLAIDATAPFNRRSEFVRKRVPGADTVDLSAYFGGE